MDCPSIGIAAVLVPEGFGGQRSLGPGVGWGADRPTIPARTLIQPEPYFYPGMVVAKAGHTATGLCLYT